MKKLLSLSALVSLVIGMFVAGTAPANAAGETNDATLSGVSLGGWTSISGGFSSDRTYYDVATRENGFDWNFTSSNGNASIEFTSPDGQVDTFTGSGSRYVSYEAKTNQVTTIKVTSEDLTKTQTYTFNVSSKVVIAPELISLSQTTLPNAGGIYVTAKVKHSMSNSWYCNSRMEFLFPDIDGNPTYEGDSASDTQFLADGTAISTFWIDATYDHFRYTGTADVRLINSCSGYESVSGQWRDQSASRTYPDYVTYAHPSVSSDAIPSTVTFGDIIDVRGFGISSWADLNYYMVDPATGERIWNWGSWHMGDEWLRFRLGGNWDASRWGTAKPVDIIVEQYDDEEDFDSVILLKKRVTFEPYAPKNVVLSPAKGPVAGGNVVKISGFQLCNYYQEGWTYVRIGGQQVSVDNFYCNYYQTSDGYHYDGIDRGTITIPAGTQAGQVPIEVNSGFGWVTLPYKYTYGAKPTLGTVSPSTVSNAGGSIVTITGSDFGLSGTPTVTIDGIKSPWVQRVSASKLLAMVPAVEGKTGAVDLNVISSSGGGALDAPGSITLSGSRVNPVISSVSPTTAGLAGGDSIIIKGSGFTVGTTGVTIGGFAAPVISASTTQLEVELPSGDAAGSVDVVVGTPTGISTKANAFTYAATPGITSFSPSTIVSTSATSKVTVTGIGFGTKGTIKVGTAAAVNYTSSANGTTISNVSIPTAKLGAVSIVITPAGAKVPFTGSVTVTGPKISYVGPDPKWYVIGSEELGAGYSKATATTAGGDAFLVEGTNFGTAGKIKVGTTLVTPLSYSDTQIKFLMPAKTKGVYDVTVVPTLGGVTAVVSSAVGVSEATPQASISKIESTVDNDRDADRFTFDPSQDSSDLFTITGTLLAGTDASKTKVYLNNEGPAITPVSVSATSITFHAPRYYSPVSWIEVKVVTDVSETKQQLGILYVGNVPPPTTMSPSYGLCLKDSLAGRSPVQLSATSDSVFGDSGTVSIDGTEIPAGAVNWSAANVTVNLDNLTTDLANPWGAKTVTFTPDDVTKIPQSFPFTCGVSAVVETKLNGNASAVTINAGTSYTASAAFVDPLPNAPYIPSATGYIYQSAEDHSADAWGRGVKAGLPIAAGDYYVRVAIGSGTYDTNKYVYVSHSNEVHLVIEGTPIAFTPKLASGAGTSITYKGQLGDGTGSSSTDLAYTNTNVADDVTEVNWQYRNKTCALADPNYGWSNGLPRDVAVAIESCGGDGTTVSAWEIRVASFKMVSGGVDKSIYYLPTYNTFTLTINKKTVTASAVKAEKVYDGSTSVTLGEITLTGSVAGDEVTLDPTVGEWAAYADATVGNAKPITLPFPLALSSYWRNNYTLSNPNLPITGKITRADAKLKLTPAVSSVIITNTQNIALTVATTNANTGQTPEVSDGLAAVVVSSKTPSVCTYSSGSVTAVKAGECVIEARQAASTNYNASISWHDGDTTVESITIKIFPAPKTLSVVADDITVAVGETVNTSAIVTGLLEGDGLDGFSFDFFRGSTRLDSAPTEVGTYKIVPSGGSLAAADSNAYTNTYKYVAGKLVITPAPPVLTAISPAHGPEAGGNTVVVKGTGLGAVTSVVIGETTLRKPKFTVNADGTQITFKAPKGVGVVDLVLKAGSASATGSYIYDAPPVITAPLKIKLKVDLAVDEKLAGQKATITGSGLKANSEYSLNLGTSVIFKANTDSAGSFSKTVTLPAKSCVESGKHDLTLTGIAPNGSKAKDTATFVLDEKCVVAATAVKTGTKEWTLSGFLFDYNDYSLTAGGLSSLSKLVPLIKGAKTVTIYGYTETDTKSAAVKKANLILATNRCDTVMKYLKSKGIKAVYKTFGKGGVNPVSLTDQSKNRRVVIEANF